MTDTQLGAKATAQPRTELSADADWKFLLGDPAGAESPAFNDHQWRTVTLPHDWSIEGTPAEKNPTGSGGGYYPAGIGWYRKAFTAPADWKGKQVGLEFDGVSMDATVYVNGHKVGNHPYAYTSFRFDITSQLNFSASNVVAVRVDNSLQPNSRWYTGSGIYRHVRAVVTEPIHIAPWGVFVSTPEASAASATVLVKSRVQNDTTESAEVTVKTVLVAPSGTKSREVEATLKLQAGRQAEITQDIALDQPALWSPKSPRMYRAITRVVNNGKILDETETPFGVRSLAWSVEKGLLLNGVPIKLVGGSLHHDNGPLGAAAFDRAEVRKVELLQAAGFNAVRTAHNPPSPAFLDACDRLGMLVLDEPFDVWTKPKAKYDYARFFNDWWQQDIDSMVLRDRNHPSIIFWGIGNEIPEAWTPEGAPIAQRLASRVRSLDSTRPLTEAFPGATYGPNPDAVFSVLDIGGYNYNLAQNQADDHRRVPGRIMMTTESLAADAFEQWQLVQDHSYIVGEFLWTAMDYLGESGIGAPAYATPAEVAQAAQIGKMLKQFMANMGADGKNPFEVAGNQDANANPLRKFLFAGYPWHAAYSGDLDLTGFRKPSSYYRDILWNGGDRVFATVRLPEPEGKKIVALGWAVYPTLPSWTWPGQNGQPLTIEVYSGTERVRLFLNDQRIGEKPTGRDQAFKAEFEVPYVPGTLRAEGLRGDRVVAQSILQTTGNPVQLKLASDRTVLGADGQDLAFVTAEALDEKGHLQINSDQRVRFAVSGQATIAAVGSGDGQSLDPYSGDTCALFHGRALVVVRTSRHPGQIKLTANADGLRASSIVIESKPVTSMPEL
ncbi:MAG TPA: glycoside hydrolase family 2 TIM barrel-domain containing protein [Candidatus Acidoferrum sp.]|nr:glycoside hydrolase family 2 TIM barrel-domain containing protein [Candidatus Acidoferrum sp.]